MSKDKQTPKELTPAQVLDSILKNNPDDHLNETDPAVNLHYKISSGSLKLDIELGGGFNCGVHRFSGVREGGKTSEALEVAKNFQKTLQDKAYIVYFKAEGRLSEDVLKRSGLDTSPEKFYVVNSNIYEFVIDTMRALVKDNIKNGNKYQYLFIIDSLDGLITRADDAKTSDDTVTTAGGSRMLSLLFKKMSLYFAQKGHMAIFISQQRAQIQINQYAPRAQNQGQTSGGNAIQHYCNFALEFKDKTKSDLIFSDDDGDSEDEAKGKIIGHYCKVKLHKTVNDNTFAEVLYPIKRKVGIWREMEVAEITLQWEFYKKEGKRLFKLNESTGIATELIKRFGDRIPKTLDGKKAYFSFFENNKDISDFLYDLYRKTLLNASSGVKL